MTLGAEPKKVAFLGVLVVVAAVALYINSSGDSTSSPTPPQQPAPPAGLTVNPSAASGGTARTRGRTAMTEIRPRVLGTRPDDVNSSPPEKIDPYLRLDLLAKVQAVPPIEAGRNLFQFGVAPPPDKPIPAIPKNVPSIPITHPTPPPVVASNTPPVTPPAPPINLKYYGYTVSKKDGHKVALLLDGDEILSGRENDTMKKRYRIVRIALTSIDIEDTQAKSTQTLKLQDIPT